MNDEEMFDRLRKVLRELSELSWELTGEDRKWITKAGSLIASIMLHHDPNREKALSE